MTASADSAAATITIAVTAVNDAPVATPQALSTNEDTPLRSALFATDADGDPLTYAHRHARRRTAR